MSSVEEQEVTPVSRKSLTVIQPVITVQTPVVMLTGRGEQQLFITHLNIAVMTLQVSTRCLQH